jgi:hypothetical protein
MFDGYEWNGSKLLVGEVLILLYPLYYQGPTLCVGKYNVV